MSGVCAIGQEWWLFGYQLFFLLEVVKGFLLSEVPIVLILICEVLIEEEQVHVQLVLNLAEELLVAV